MLSPLHQVCVALKWSSSCCRGDKCKIPQNVSSDSPNLFLYPQPWETWASEEKTSGYIEHFQDGILFHIGKCRKGEDLTLREREGAGGVRTRQTWWQDRLGGWRHTPGLSDFMATSYETSFFYYIPVQVFDLNLTAAHSSVHKVSNHKQVFPLSVPL